MRKILLIFFCFVLLFLFPTLSLAMSAEAALDPPVDWAWLVAQVDSGIETVSLPNSIVCDSETGLKPEKSVKIIGNHFTLTGALVDGGTVFFEDVTFAGVNGVEEQNGSPALTLRGQGTIAVLSGASRVTAGHSGPRGEYGGDGIVLSGDGQGLILRGNTAVSGNIGWLYGGSAIHVLGCNSSILATDTTIITGHAGVFEGGAGIKAPSCCKTTLMGQVSASGGSSQHEGGSGIDTHPCETCSGRSPVQITNSARLTGGVGETGGSALRMARTAAERKDETPDLSIEENSMLLGASGGTAGSALIMEGCVIQFSGTPMLFSGSHYITEASVMSLTDCTLTGNPDEAEQIAGEKTDVYPARDVSQIIQNTLSKRETAYTSKPLEDGLNTRTMVTKLDGHSVEKGKVTQARLDGNGLTITLWDGTLETRLQFNQRLMKDGAEGLRFVLISTTSQEWPTVRIAVTSLNKLQKEGFTQLAYTCIDPVYNERIVDIAALLEAVEAHEEPVTSLYLGTADDCVIFVLEDEKNRVYQETLMNEILRPLEDAENSTEESAS